MQVDNNQLIPMQIASEHQKNIGLVEAVDCWQEN